jgi:hypothetical protein
LFLEQTPIFAISPIFQTARNLQIQKSVNALQEHCKFIILEFSGLMGSNRYFTRILVLEDIVQSKVCHMLMKFEESKNRLGVLGCGRLSNHASRTKTVVRESKRCIVHGSIPCKKINLARSRPVSGTTMTQRQPFNRNSNLSSGGSWVAWAGQSLSKASETV